MPTDLASIQASWGKEELLCYLPETYTTWPVELLVAWEKYGSDVDNDEFEYAGGLYAARVVNAEEVAFFNAAMAGECCGWHEEDLSVQTSSGEQVLRVGFSYGH